MFSPALLDLKFRSMIIGFMIHISLDLCNLFSHLLHNFSSMHNLQVPLFVNFVAYGEEENTYFL